MELVDLAEYHKNSIAQNYGTFATAPCYYQADTKYYVGDLPAQVVVTTIYYFPRANLVDGGLAIANPPTARIKYLANETTLRDLGRVYYHNRLKLVVDTGRTAWDGIIVIAYMDIKHTLGYYR